MLFFYYGHIVHSLSNLERIAITFVIAIYSLNTFSQICFTTLYHCKFLLSNLVFAICNSGNLIDIVAMAFSSFINDASSSGGLGVSSIPAIASLINRSFDTPALIAS